MANTVRTLGVNGSKLADDILSVLEDLQEEFLDDVAKFFFSEYRFLVRANSNWLQSEKSGSYPFPPKGKGAFTDGKYHASIAIRRNSQTSISIGARAPYAPFVEFGVPAGGFKRPPPVGPLIRWAKKKGMRDPVRAAHAISAKMFRVGMAARPAMRQAEIATRANISSIAKDTIARRG